MKIDTDFSPLSNLSLSLSFFSSSHFLSLSINLSYFTNRVYLALTLGSYLSDCVTYINTDFFMVSKQENSKIPVQNPSMATLSSSVATSSTTFGSTMNVMNQPLLLLSNMSNMMTIKLDNANYIVWKHQISMILETYSLFELL